MAAKIKNDISLFGKLPLGARNRINFRELHQARVTITIFYRAKQRSLKDLYSC